MRIANHLAFSIALLLLLVSGSGSACASPDGVEERLHSANLQYAAGKYQEAISSYRQIIARYGFSAEILHNLANSYAGAEQYGQAILHYLRGLHLAPGDADLQGDLALIREKRGIFTAERSAAQRLFGLLDMNQWALLALGGYGGLSLMLLVHLCLPLSRMLAPFAVLLLTVTFFSLYGMQQRQEDWNAGVITAPGTKLLVSPFPSAASRGDIGEGSIIRCVKHYETYCHVRDDTGRWGWISTSAFEPVVTTAATYARDDAAR